MSLFKRKNVILGILVVALLVTSYVNYTMFGKSTATIAEEDNPNNAKLVQQLDLTDVVEGSVTIDSAFFTDYRISRDVSRSENISTLESIVANANSTKANIEQANQELVKLTQLSESEMRIEGMIKSKGFRDCVVFIGSGQTRVLVDAATLTRQQAVQIQSIIVSELNLEPANVFVAASGIK
jgi:stage III sporulation protein AH